MARNEEKQLGRLNRLVLKQLKEEQLKKNPPRPRLDSLETSVDIKKWLPSIKRDIDFYLKQSQVPCYPENHIEEFSVKIQKLTREYHAYLHKLKQLEPDSNVVPWTERAYDRKRKLNDDQHDSVVLASISSASVGLTATTKEQEAASKYTDGGQSVGTSRTFLSESTQETIVSENMTLLHPDQNNLPTVPKTSKKEKDPSTSISSCASACQTSNSSTQFTPIATPILNNDRVYKSYFGYNKEKPPVILNANPDLEDKPLQFKDEPAARDTLVQKKTMQKFLKRDLNKKWSGAIRDQVYTSLSHQDMTNTSSAKVQICSEECSCEPSTNCVTEGVVVSLAAGSHVLSQCQDVPSRAASLNLPYSDSSDEGDS